MVTPRGEFLYRVKKTQVVNPEDVWVLAPTKAATITLITCYPFSFVGHAPQRFIVQAERVGPGALRHTSQRFCPPNVIRKLVYDGHASA
jgi:LPXTG-site transpeptidase (sortase) family protein